MTDRPILFSGSMIRALLAGTKTQTRRVLQGLGDQPIVEYDGMYMWKQGYRWGAVTDPKFPPGVRFAIGDRLWVREAWRTESRAYDDLAPTDMGGEETVIFEADADWKLNKSVGRLRQGMHMPRWASRLTLIVTEVRVQRLQEISEEDAAAEGLLSWRYQDCDGDPKLDGRPYKATLWHWAQPETEFDGFSSATGAYRDLWDHLNEARGYGWATNPWVIAVSFTVERRNIDVGRP